MNMFNKSKTKQQLFHLIQKNRLHMIVWFIEFVQFLIRQCRAVGHPLILPFCF